MSAVSAAHHNSCHGWYRWKASDSTAAAAVLAVLLVQMHYLTDMHVI